MKAGPEKRTRRFRRLVFGPKGRSKLGFWNLLRSVAESEDEQQQLFSTMAALGLWGCGLAGAWRSERGEFCIGPQQYLFLSGSGDGSSSRHTAAPGGTAAARRTARQPAYSVGLALRGTAAREALLDVQYVSNRILVARFQGSMRLRLVVAYAPTGSHKGERKAFFRLLHNTLNAGCGLDFTVLMGDWNGQVGSAASRSAADNWGGALGGHGVGKRNACGVEILEFAQRNGLCVANTFFQHPPTRKLTHRNNLPGVDSGEWQLAANKLPPPPQPNSQMPARFWRESRQAAAWAQCVCLDYFLVQRRFLSSVCNVRVRQSANPAWSRSDHQLLVAEIKLKLKPPATKQQRQQRRQQRFDRQALQNKEDQLNFQAAVTAQLQQQPAVQQAIAATEQLAQTAAPTTSAPSPAPSLPGTPPEAAPASPPADAAAAAAAFLRQLELPPPPPSSDEMAAGCTAALLAAAEATVPKLQHTAGERQLSAPTLQLIQKRQRLFC